jgi:hypothetical protein
VLRPSVGRGLHNVGRLLARLGRRRVPAGIGRGRGFPQGWADPMAGGAGVREPRRPYFSPPGLSTAATPTPEQFLDLGSR